jgi:uncharacterized protein with PIN domain
LARLYSNENFPFAVVRLLRILGHDVLTTVDAGQAGKAIPDNEVLQFATTENRIVLTFNRRDFIKLHTRMADHAGITMCKVDTDAERLTKKIDTLLGANPVTAKQLFRVNRG